MEARERGQRREREREGGTEEEEGVNAKFTKHKQPLLLLRVHNGLLPLQLALSHLLSLSLSHCLCLSIEEPLEDQSGK